MVELGQGLMDTMVVMPLLLRHSLVVGVEVHLLEEISRPVLVVLVMAEPEYRTTSAAYLSGIQQEVEEEPLEELKGNLVPPAQGQALKAALDKRMQTQTQDREVAAIILVCTVVQEL